MGHRSGWVAAVVVMVIALAVGAVGYNIGVSHGLALATPAAGGPGAAVPYMWYRPWGFGSGFGPLLFLLLFFGLFRSLLWGRAYRGRWHQAGACGVPPRFEEWHRRAHEQMNNPPPNPPSHNRV